MLHSYHAVDPAEFESATPAYKRLFYGLCLLHAVAQVTSGVAAIAGWQVPRVCRFPLVAQESAAKKLRGQGGFF